MKAYTDRQLIAMSKYALINLISELTTSRDEWRAAALAMSYGGPPAVPESDYRPKHRREREGLAAPPFRGTPTQCGCGVPSTIVTEHRARGRRLCEPRDSMSEKHPNGWREYQPCGHTEGLSTPVRSTGLCQCGPPWRWQSGGLCAECALPLPDEAY